ncbi:MAG: NAD(P)-binding domain-containing protein [Chitinophagaceae bacterium]|nr:NAD(P)-binding domain-containing protein [Chitinophagaceae bacterium]
MKIGIIGSGTMGAGIAQVAAQAGNNVVVIDTNETVLNKAKHSLQNTLSKLTEKGKLSAEKAASIFSLISWELSINKLNESDLVIEAIVERLDIKQTLFAALEHIVSEQCILASNTSSLSVTSIASACNLPQRVIGIHFFNPAPVMELVEIVPALQTSQDIVAKSIAMIDSWNKKTVRTKDTPGFIVNRIARPFYSEAIRLYDEGVASIETIDHAMKVYGGFRMGPFELMDLIGHDVNYAVTETVWSSFYFDPRYTPSFTQKRLVEAKWFGRKSGRGFYDYADTAIKHEPELQAEVGKDICWRVLVMLINEAANALFLHVASKEDIDLAMTKGVNYPKGLLQWADEKGIAACVEKLDALYEEYHEDRYRCSPLLRKMKASNTNFY